MLPKIAYPTFSYTSFDNKTKIKYRPYTVKEEKLLLMAYSSLDDKEFVVNNILEVLKNCVQTEIDIQKLPYIDIEMLIVKLRAASVNDVIEATYNDDGIQTPVKIDLKEVKYVIPENYTNKVMINDNCGLIMNLMTFEQYMNTLAQNSNDLLLDLFIKCIDQVFDEENSYFNGQDFNLEELKEFIESIPKTPSIKFEEEVYKYFKNLPYISLTLNINGKDVELKGIQSFLA